ncbi:MAG: GDP-mannose 4,6-dehydratase [Nitrospira sp.]|nr:GDP-mannose 4,6-dehydratase [Nitrospira sp.]
MITAIGTGATGFIGSNFVRLLFKETNVHVVIVDQLTYAGHPATLIDIQNDGRVTVLQEDITGEQTI